VVAALAGAACVSFSVWLGVLSLLAAQYELAKPALLYEEPPSDPQRVIVAILEYALAIALPAAGVALAARIIATRVLLRG
jgi:hypothetical protein